MALRNIVNKSEEVLHKNCRPVEKFDEKLGILLDDMAETMYKAKGVGLAAPQVGILRRAVVIDVGDGLVELINPVIVKKSGSFETEEGCLSLTGVRRTRRYKEIEVEYQDMQFQRRRQKFSGWTAQIIQHECDHLEGILI